MKRKSKERKKKGITDLYRILFNGGHQVDDGSSNNDLSIKWEIKKRAFPSNVFFFSYSLMLSTFDSRRQSSRGRRRRKRFRMQQVIGDFQDLSLFFSPSYRFGAPSRNRRSAPRIVYISKSSSKVSLCASDRLKIQEGKYN